MKKKKEIWGKETKDGYIYHIYYTNGIRLFSKDFEMLFHNGGGCNFIDINELNEYNKDFPIFVGYLNVIKENVCLAPWADGKKGVLRFKKGLYLLYRDYNGNFFIGKKRKEEK